MQTILGAGGVIGRNLAKSLPQFTDEIRLVSRNPQKVNEQDHLLSADLMDAAQTREAVAGSEVVYLAVGLPYTTKVWQEKWPIIMDNTLEACKAHGAKLVFFDNVYCYGKVDGWMTEDSPMNPISKKGEVRARIADTLMQEIGQGNIEGLIARSADFYGPETPLSTVNVTIFDKLAEGKAAQIMVRADLKHSLTYTPDAGKATALLGNSPEAYGQVWHLPTDSNTLTTQELLEQAAAAFGVEPKGSPAPKWLLRIVGLFVPIVKEGIEMLYQNEEPYLFDSSKFDQAFDFPTTPYARGIIETVKSYQKT